MNQDEISNLPLLPTARIDTVALGRTPAGITALCDEHLRRARELLEAVRGLEAEGDAQLTIESTLDRIDQIALETALAGGFASLMGEAHPDAEVREAARGARPKLVALHTEMSLDAKLAAVLRRFAALEPELPGTRARLLSDLLRDFRRNGLELPPDEQQRLREINDDLSRLGQQFSMNLSEATESIEVRPEQLAGLPEAFLRQHPPNERGVVALTTDYPDYFPVLTYAEDRTVAARLNLLFDNRAADLNLPILDRVLALREEKANLLGYATWAEYMLEPRMARTPAAVRQFLDRAAQAVHDPARQEYAQFQAERTRHLQTPPDEPIPVYDRLFFEQKLRAQHYGFDGKLFSEYLEVEHVVTGVLQLVSALFSIEFREVEAPTWHPDVRVLDVVRDEGLVGRLYLDLYPRPAKYKHAAMFEIRPGKALADGSYLHPVAALVCNFPQPGASGPALLTLEEVTTLFHELGHGLHHLLTREALASYAGTNTAHDFVETPSQMLEEWAFQRETLDVFACHHVTGEPVPDDLFQAMRRSRAFGRALATERQLALASLDFEYHTRPVPFDTGVVLREVMAARQSFVYPDSTHFQATFGHLMGYDAGYYGYQWALAISRDVLTRFEREGFMNEQTARDWLDTVLSRGAGVDEARLVERFLGRETNLDAYAAYLRGA